MPGDVRQSGEPVAACQTSPDYNRLHDGSDFFPRAYSRGLIFRLMFYGLLIAQNQREILIQL